jgi:hypothetical protein
MLSIYICIYIYYIRIFLGTLSKLPIRLLRQHGVSEKLTVRICKYWIVCCTFRKYHYKKVYPFTRYRLKEKMCVK